MTAIVTLSDILVHLWKIPCRRRRRLFYLAVSDYRVVSRNYPFTITCDEHAMNETENLVELLEVLTLRLKKVSTVYTMCWYWQESAPNGNKHEGDSGRLSSKGNFPPSHTNLEDCQVSQLWQTKDVDSILQRGYFKSLVAPLGTLPDSWLWEPFRPQHTSIQPALGLPPRTTHGMCDHSQNVERRLVFPCDRANDRFG